ncbi:hypothetical protein IFM89_013910 [Coptis chinensis]|uniref:Cytochrome P450 n=1 Tax=Coptis chinensis TaxID=261450 RepID=A0A835HEG6_9MAGN|nr:hypothetical protein IFM89_013910 [Coptis chinensis]
MLSTTPTNTLAVHSFLNISHGICTSNPSNIEYLLRTNFSNYIKGSRFHNCLHDLIGDGIFNVDSELWVTQRKIASFEFNTRSLRSFLDQTVQHEISSRLVPLLSISCDNSESIDLQDVFRKFAFDNICKLAFGDDPGCLEQKQPQSNDNSISFVKAFDEAAGICFERFVSPLPLLWKTKKFLNVGSEKRLRNGVNVINNYAMKIIESREDNSTLGDRQDLLSRFMNCDEPRDTNKKRKFLRDIIISFVLAGKDSTSTALTWFFWLVSANFDCQTRIYNELTQVPNIRSGNFSYEDLKQLHYLHAAISESLRLFPPVPINTRLTVNDDVLPDGTQVKAGWFADYSAYAVGRNESVWGKDCNVFRPERWLDEYGVFQPLDQFRFPVFHSGPRICLGKEMAYMQMKSIAAAVIYGFEVVAVDGGGSVEKMKKPPYVLSLVLKMKGGLPVRLKRRS